MSKINLLFFLIASLLLSGCSSDPFANAGECENPGESKIIENRVAVCTGIESKPKWYFEGKYFEDTLLLAKIKYAKSSLTDSLKETLTKENLTVEDYVEAFRVYKISIEELAEFAENEPRWDSLLEAKSRLTEADVKLNYLSDEMTKQQFDWVKGKATLNQRNAARQEYMNYLKSEYEKIETDYQAKLNAMASSLGSKYSITSESLLLVFIIRYAKATK